MRKILAMALLMMFLIANAWAQPTPSMPPSPESMGLQAPQPTASTTAVPQSESGQVTSTTAASAQVAAPSAEATATASAYMVVPQGISAPNKFYIPYSPSTTASCYYGQWVPMWLDIRGYGPLYGYEWYPDGKLVTQYLANIPYPSWQKMWFYGDAPGWHTLQYYCNGWSNYIYVYVYGSSSYPPYNPGSYPPSPYPPYSATPEPGCSAQITVTSNSMSGYSIYVDGNYVGSDGSNGDQLDGIFTFTVTGNQPHTINVYNQGFNYAATDTYNCGQTYSLHV